MTNVLGLHFSTKPDDILKFLIYRLEKLDQLCKEVSTQVSPSAILHMTIISAVMCLRTCVYLHANVSMANFLLISYVYCFFFLVFFLVFV